jgi:hypothetical protein
VHDRIGGNFSFGFLGDLDFFTDELGLLEGTSELFSETLTDDGFLNKGICEICILVDLMKFNFTELGSLFIYFHEMSSSLKNVSLDTAVEWHSSSLVTQPRSNS